MAKCEGKSRRTGLPCKLHAEHGSRWCKFHGSRASKGPANNMYRHGGYSKYAPARMQEDLLRIAKDKELLALTNELVLLKGRVSDVLQRVDTGESGRTWKQLKMQVKARQKAARAGDAAAEMEALHEIESLVSDGVRDWESWDEVRSTIRDVTRIAESQRRYAMEQRNMVSIEIAYSLMVTLVNAVRRLVADEHTCDLIASEFTRLAHNQHGQLLAATDSELVA